METLTVAALLCAVMSLTSAAALPEEMPGQEPRSEPRIAICGPEWTQCNNRQILYISTLLTWTEAERNCVSLGGHLASVHKPGEYYTIQSLVYNANLKHQRAWIGGSRCQQSNRWLWSDGTPFDYSNWACGKPNNLNGNQHCIQMNYGDKLEWNDLSCSLKLPSICAK